tara:strand:- start:170 stop:496 length:327 start_codon:yes stop_codon:yes gene_type:complete
MANIFKNQYTDLGTGNSDVVTAIASGTAIVLTLRCTNVDGTNDATVTVEVVDGSSGDAKIASTMTVPADSSLELAGTSKIVLETGDKIQALASASGDIEVFASYLNIT